MKDFVTASWIGFGTIVLGIAFALTYLFTPLLERLAPRLGLMDIPDATRSHARPTPRAGGIAVFTGFHAACAIMFLYSGQNLGENLDVNWWFRILAVSSLLLAVGLADDAWNIRPGFKLAGQTAAALLAYALNIRFGSIIGFQLPLIADLAITVLWFLVFINIFNLIDGMDGLATGLALIASLGIILSLATRGMRGDILPLLALSGACVAFLRYNFHPARIFLGDSGSMFLGLMLAAIALPTASKSAMIPSLLVPFLAVGVPLFDTMLAIWRRSIRQNGRFSAILERDTDHLHHRLIRAGLSQRQVAGLLYLFSAALITVGLLFVTLNSYIIGISLTAFVGGVYVVVRHLAHVELWDTGNAILRGLQRPPHQALVVLLYPLADVLLMGGLLTITLHIFTNQPYGGSLTRLLQHGVIWTGIPFMSLILSGTYRRVWSRAGAAEFATLFISLAGGLLLAGGAANLLLEFTVRDLLAYLTFYGSLTVAALTGLRAIRPVILDVMAYRWPHQAAGQVSPPRRLILYGAGQRAMLFLREQKYAILDNPVREQISGMLDEDSNLHGRLIHGYTVLGGIDWLQHHGDEVIFEELVIAEDLLPEDRDRLLDIARQRKIEVSEWRTERQLLAAHEGSV